MSNKQRLTPEECQERKDAHLDRTIKEIGYEEINQNEYKRLKKYDPQNVNGYTIRVRHKYYKKKPTIPKVIILDNNKLSIVKYAKEFPENWKRICGELELKETIDYCNKCIQEIERDVYENGM